MNSRSLCAAACVVLATRISAQTTATVSNPPATGSAGSTLSITETFWNNTSNSYGGGTQWLSLVPVAGGAGITVGSRVVPGMMGGLHSTVTTTVTIPSSVPLGSYLVGAGGQGCNMNCLKSTSAVTISAGAGAFPLSVVLNVGGPGLGYIAITDANTGAAIGNCPPSPNCTPTIAAGKLVKLTYVGVQGGMFQGWVAGSNTGCAAGIAPCTFTMDAAKTISGNIKPGSMPNVALQVYVSGQGTVTGRKSGSAPTFQNCNQPFGGCVTSAPAGTQFVITANPGTVAATQTAPARPATFVNWTGGAGCSGTSPQLLIAPSSAVSCTANFQ